MISKKICMLGGYAVGKTSLVARTVRGIFSDKYLSTVGVKIDRKTLEVDGTPTLLMLWDLAGDDPFQNLRTSYLRGASGYLLVVDGTRPDTVETALRMRDLVHDTVGPLPHLLLLNKADLVEEWALEEAMLAPFAGTPMLSTSAKTGDRVGAAFEQLTRAMLDA